jgi:hypothetical protein
MSSCVEAAGALLDGPSTGALDCEQPTRAAREREVDSRAFLNMPFDTHGIEVGVVIDCMIV